MSKSERIIFILSLLRRSKFLTARDLAQKCQVSERTIYRDIISISVINIPIYFENGYKLLSQDFLPPVNFTPTEAEYLVSLLVPESQCPQEGTQKIAARIIDKLKVSRAKDQIALVAS
jgi:predicted DNA-binding transcriptional regulator YafY